MAREKRSKSQKRLPNNQPPKESDYDLSKSFRKVQPYSRGCSRKPKHDQTTDTSVISGSFRNNQIESVEELGNQTITESTWSHFYTHLEDKLDSFTNKNEEAHTSLRQELEGKLAVVDKKCENKIPWNVFVWIIGGIIGLAIIIVSFWWNISYCEIIKLPNKVQQIENEIKRMNATKHTHSADESISVIQMIINI